MHGQQQFVGANGIPVLISLLKTQDTTRQEKEWACTVFANLASNGLMDKALLDAGIIPVLVDLVTADDATLKIQAVAMDFFVNLGFKVTAHSRLIDPEVFRAIHSIVTHAGVTPRSKDSAATFLERLAREPNNRMAMMRGGAIVSLLPLLDFRDNTEQSQAIALSAVDHLTQNRLAPAQLIQGNGLPRILRYLEDPWWAGRSYLVEPAGRILANLTGFSDGREALLRLNGGATLQRLPLINRYRHYGTINLIVMPLIEQLMANPVLDNAGRSIIKSGPFDT